MPLISTILKNPNKDNILCKIDYKMAELAKCKLQSIQYGFNYKDTSGSMEYLSLLRDIYIEKINNNPCLCNVSKEDLIYKINKEVGPIQMIQHFVPTPPESPKIEEIDVLADIDGFIIDDAYGTIIFAPTPQI